MRNILTNILVAIVCIGVSAVDGIAQTVAINSGFSDTLTCVEGTFKVPLDVNGTYVDSNVFIVEISDNNGSFSNPVQVGTNPDPAATLPTNCKLPASITPGTGYRIRVRSIYPAYTSSPAGQTIRVSDYPTINIGANGPLCEGQTLNLTASSPNYQPTYDWTGPNNYKVNNTQNPSISNVTNNNSGTYRVAVTSYKCTAEDTIDILITPAPKIDYVTPPTTACEEDKVNFNYDCIVCRPLPPGTVSIVWTYPSGTSTPQSGVIIQSVKPSHAGTYKVKISIGNCSDTGSTSLTVKPLPDTPIATSNSPICVGDMLLLNGTSNDPGATFSWEGPDGFKSAGSSPSIANTQKTAEGDYKLYATVNGCRSKPGIAKVEIGDPLSILNITGDTMLCPGDRMLITAQTNVVKGIEWKKLPSNIIISQTRTYGKTGVTAEDAGTYQVTQELLGCKSPPSYITLHIPDLKYPDAKNNGPLCLGEQLELTSATTDNGTYSWTGPDGFTSGDQNPVISQVNNATAGTYHVKVDLEYCTDEDSTVVTIKPMPEITDIGSNSPVCTGTELQLNAQSSLEDPEYIWRGPDGFSSDEQNPTLPFNTNGKGTYSVRVIVDGCESESKSTDVEAREGPGETTLTSNEPLSEGETLELNATNEKDSVRFVWIGPDGATWEGDNYIVPVATFRDGGEYEVLTIYNTCTTSTQTEVYVKDILGITIALYPNPNNGNFTIEGITQTDDPLQIAIFSPLGELVYRDAANPVRSKFKKEIQLPATVSGVYFLKVATGKETEILKFSLVQQ